MNNTNTSRLTALTDWTLIHVKGPDAAPFLQNLFTNHILNLPIGSEHLSGFCSPKGRLLASFWVTHPSQECFDLWISKDISAEFIKKLMMYRLRSKVEIALIDSSMCIYGEFSNTPLPSTQNVMCNLPSIQYDDSTYYRRVFVDTLQEINTSSEKNMWSILEVESGIPRITAKTQDLFVPQMINFESIGGVDFKKGCYPGQEIVARSQYLGNIKRRLKIGTIETSSTYPESLTPGSELYSENDPEQACGVVVLSSLDNLKERYHLQIEIKLSELHSNLYFQQEDGKKSGFIHIKEPPYPLLTI